jgi:hypothetical protein
MGDEQFTTQHETSQRESAPSTNQRLSYATQRAEVLFGSYRRGDANDPERYVTAIAAVLTLYDFDLMREVTDPRTGIQNTEEFMTFMPQSGELKRYCDKVAAHRERIAKMASLPRPAPASHRLEAPIARDPGSLANVFVPQGHGRYAKLVEWTQTADPKFWKFGHSSDNRPGIWVSHDVWDGGRDTVGHKFDWKNLKPEARDLTLSPAARAATGMPEQQDEEVPF